MGKIKLVLLVACLAFITAAGIYYGPSLVKAGLPGSPVQQTVGAA